MDLADYLTADRVLRLRARTKAAALKELTQAVAAAGLGVEAEALYDAVERRERLMSTGIGHGLAVPHVRMEGISGLAMAIGLQPEGIDDYPSMDAEPVRLVVLIVAPAGAHEAYIRLLAEVMGVLKDPDARARLLRMQDADEAYRFLTGGA